jgi:hypothetical protein
MDENPLWKYIGLRVTLLQLHTELAEIIEERVEF